MARISSQKAIAKIGNKFDMILIAAIRARELRQGSNPLVAKVSTPCITAIREIEESKVGRDYLRKISRRVVKKPLR